MQGYHTDTLVVLAQLFSNSTPSPLTRAITAYRTRDGAGRIARQPLRIPKRAKRLSAIEVARLAERYQAGATVYELANAFGIHRTIISQHLKGAGVEMRLKPVSEQQVEAAITLYNSGLSLTNIGSTLGFNASTICNALKRHGVDIRKPWEHPLQRNASNPFAPPGT